MPRLIDVDSIKSAKYHDLPYTHIHPVGVDVQAYEMGWNDALDAVADFAPTVDVVPFEDYKSMEQTVNKLTKAIADAEHVRYGHWCVTQAYPHTVYCSECFQRFAQAHWAVWKDGSLPRDYCPSCGAKMDEERRDDAGNKD